VAKQPSGQEAGCVRLFLARRLSIKSRVAFVCSPAWPSGRPALRSALRALRAPAQCWPGGRRQSLGRAVCELSARPASQKLGQKTFHDEARLPAIATNNREAPINRSQLERDSSHTAPPGQGAASSPVCSLGGRLSRAKISSQSWRQTKGERVEFLIGNFGARFHVARGPRERPKRIGAPCLFCLLPVQWVACRLPLAGCKCARPKVRPQRLGAARRLFVSHRVSTCLRADQISACPSQRRPVLQLAAESLQTADCSSPL